MATKLAREPEIVPSFNAQVRALEVGESVAKVKRLSVVGIGVIGDVIRELTHSIAPAVSKIAKSDGRVYTVDRGSFIAFGTHHVIVAVVVTRES